MGQSGKKNLKKILDWRRSIFRGTASALFGCFMIGGCATDLGEPLQSGQVLALHGLQGRWVGEIAPTDSNCGATTHALMSIGQGAFALDPFQGTTVIRGDVADDGHLSGKLVRQGAEHQDLSIAFEAQATGADQIGGTLQSGRCHWTVALHRG